MDELLNQINQLRSEIQDLHYLISKKTGQGSADIKGRIVAPSTVTGAGVEDNSITAAKIAANAVLQSEWASETVTVTVTSGSSTGTATVTSGSIVVGWYPTGNMDQFVDNISISGTTLTITLAANATADNTFKVTLLKS